MYGIDDQYWQPEWNQGPDWSLAQPGAAASQQQAPTQQPQFPWMTAAAASPGDPWSSWSSAPQWPTGGVNSLTQQTRSMSSLAISIKKLPVAATPAPVATHNKYAALADNVGADGQTSSVHMSFGEVAVLKPSRPRRGKKDSLTSFEFSTRSASEPSEPVA